MGLVTTRPKAAACVPFDPLKIVAVIDIVTYTVGGGQGMGWGRGDEDTHAWVQQRLSVMNAQLSACGVHFWCNHDISPGTKRL